MSDFRRLSETVYASPQITPDEVAEAARDGFVLVINNRPDGEEAGQPSGDAIAKAAHDHGIDYKEIPVDHTGFSEPQVEAMSAALSGTDGKVLAYCRSGTRSTNLWALARAHQGADSGGLVAAAMDAGYDISALAPTLEMLAARAKA
ncbi:TIGR01244 family sulfur transferase [Aurantiacibacter poecillastricola]|uniref:TIGR01244 family sulfur transferase n=1 Tax=Aurantiacibacter poecillastricola TaxID=3064385 RepID=UPI00273F6D28|nr:TIGR01244 family sulfur transferase [Aurantiacibacter sp. 219JJ12-13]MDP5260328.1 TIGR01244 family sulfur transferase [Aurantiacibacter sp. 219JJ12-13]